MSHASDIGRPTATLVVCALLGLAVNASGCIEDADCGVCDPDNLIVESISGINYASDKIHVLSPPCEGDRCPSPFSKGSYFIEDIGPCEDTEAAQATPSAEEYCKISPLVTAYGIEFVFNNLLDARSVELVRKRPDNPQLFEVYDWKSDVIHVEGPITRWNGDYVRGNREEPDLMTRMVNLSCIDNLGTSGVEFDHEQYADPATNPCNDMVGDKPRKMFEDGEVHAYRGVWTAWSNSCASPQEGPDTCCTFCEWLLSTKVERYGVDPGGVPRNPLMGALIEGDLARPYASAIVCREGAAEDVVVDTYAACREFIPAVDRSDEEQRWEYEWCEGPVGPTCPTSVQTFDVPLFDKLRETHPDLRPIFDSKGRRYEKRDRAGGGAFCRASSDCGEAGHDLPGTTCMGVNDETKLTCLVDAHADGGCSIDGEGDGLEQNVGGFCRPSWTTICADGADTIGGERAYCMDRRFGATGSGACKITTDAVENIDLYGANAGFKVGCEDDGTDCSPSRAGADRELSHCDWNENGKLTSAECCVGSIAGPDYKDAADGSFACDPFYQSNLVDKALYQRDTNLPSQTKGCKCPTDTERSLEDYREELEEDSCFDAVAIGCFDGNSDDDASERMLREDRAGDYAVKFVESPGGIVYDPAVKGIDWRPADTGGVPRADIEQCAEDNVDPEAALPARNRHDGWRAQDPFTPESFEDFDRGMCSGQEYKVVFNEPGNPDNPAFIVDKVGNTLEGKSVYTFETPQFHVVPGSGFPTDNLRIGACDEYRLGFSNKYDVSTENLEKIQLYRVECTKPTDGTPRVCEWAAPNFVCNRDSDGDGDADPLENACCEPISAEPPYYAPVAGGPGCARTKEELDAGGPCARPCLTVDVGDQDVGEVGLRVDSTVFDQVLRQSEVYRMIVPSAPTLEAAAADPAVYDAAFWDVCGMPLVSANAVEYLYEFEIDAPKCKEDLDRDNVPFSCDNADRHFNPLQDDIDADSVGDIVDLCPVAGGDPYNSADSDKDGVGNICDTCRQPVESYNENASLALVPAYMQVRNIPYQQDADEDGIGDVCDNCIWTPNCELYGDVSPLVPYHVTDPIDPTNDDRCQRDINGDMIGDSCLGLRRDGSIGAIGFKNEDDFDQDGISNQRDKCPRQPLADAFVCAVPEDCDAGRSCDDGLCNHLDSEAPSGDGVGDQCDSCPFVSNGMQIVEGGMQDDDEDGDFVGKVCETTTICDDRKDPLPFGFFRVHSNSFCCTTQLVAAEMDYDDPETEVQPDVATGDLLLAGTCENPDEIRGGTCTPLRAPHPEIFYETLPVRDAAGCPEEQRDGVWICRQLPAPVANRPGILVPPPGCEDALAEYDEGRGTTTLINLLNPLTDADFATESDPFDALWQNQCFLPQFDQDYDGIGDSCDLCPFAYDPQNTQFINRETGRLYPTDGAYCNGDYLPDNICDAIGKPEDEETGGSESGSDSGSGSGSGSGDSGSDSGG